MGSEAARLDRDFFARPTLAVAQGLLGCLLVSELPEGRTSGRIVETEGYLGPEDPASHAARLRRGRVTAMWGPPGVAYVYRSYGMHAMLNVVCEPEGQTGAVLVRALEPIEGVEWMWLRRSVGELRLLCSGPGRLCQAMGIGLDDHGRNLVTDERFWIEAGAGPKGVTVGSRIGITRGVEQLWRFFETGSRFVSAHRRGGRVTP